MKNTIIISVLVSFLFIGCEFSNNGIKGSGTVTIEQRAILPFDQIKVAGGAFTVYLSQGDTESVEVKIDDNLQQYVVLRNEGNKLILDIKDNVNFARTTKNNVYISLKNITLLDISGVCTVKTNNLLNCDMLTINVSGVANGELEVYCNKLNVNTSGVANIVLHGSAAEFDVRQSGVGNLNAANFNAARVTIVNSGVGSVSIYASQELSMTNSGVGSITYSGDAEIKSMNSSSVGRITRAR